MTMDEEVVLIESLVGRTIVAASWIDMDPTGDWNGHEVGTLTLDDGRRIRFGAWGHVVNSSAGIPVSLFDSNVLPDLWDMIFGEGEKSW